MENDPKTLLMQLISNLELAEMRANQLTDPGTGFCMHSRIRYVPRIVNCLLDEVKGILGEAFPPDTPILHTAVRLHEPTENLDWTMEHAQLLMDQQITNGLGVPNRHYDSPIQVE